MSDRASEERVGVGLRTAVAIVAVLLVLPTLVIVPMSFSAGTTFAFPPADWSLRWYQNFFTSPRWMSALGNSVLIGVISAVAATILGIPAALGIARLSRRRAGAARSLILAPVIVPGVVIAIATYVVFLQVGLVGDVRGFVLAHTVLAIPFVVISVSASLAGFDDRLPVAASSLGASPGRVFFSVTMPLIAPGVLSGLVFAFVTSFDEVVVSLFLQSPRISTLPVQMYNSITFQIDPTISAASSVIVVFTTAVILLVQLVPSRRRNT
ncbi:ABC transporter permease [Rathayibacter sp. Leaf296]|uniref:ABC transporter permease n=1 Tax=Rathayibacter sp. Leaf296 TaxID=1736327 RepID=UPI000703B65E|nr:ABC transporter permease [Rathayibacter sp. Leaf296]KQQ08513.1 polyamine ABC transporter permease [Rathayibacter sp. Leaf296]